MHSDVTRPGGWPILKNGVFQNTNFYDLSISEMSKASKDILLSVTRLSVFRVYTAPKSDVRRSSAVPNMSTEFRTSSGCDNIVYIIHMPLCQSFLAECIRYGTTQCLARAVACNLGQICVSVWFWGLECDDTTNGAVFSNMLLSINAGLRSVAYVCRPRDHIQHLGMMFLRRINPKISASAHLFVRNRQKSMIICLFSRGCCGTPLELGNPQLWSKSEVYF